MEMGAIYADTTPSPGYQNLQAELGKKLTA
jgi:hypothetical protein